MPKWTGLALAPGLCEDGPAQRSGAATKTGLTTDLADIAEFLLVETVEKFGALIVA